MTAVDLALGSTLWSFQAGDAIYGGTTVSDGSVFFTSHDAWVYSLDAATGDVQWKTELLRRSTSTPVVVQGLVIVGSWDDRVYALDAETGANVWNFWAGDIVVASVAASDDSVFFGAYDGYAYSVSLRTGSLNWRQRIGEGVRSGPALHEGLVYIAEGVAVFALDEGNGSVVWQFETDGDVVAPIVSQDGVVYAGSHDDSLYALAAGFPEGYSATAVDPIDDPGFEPLSADALKQRLTEVFGSDGDVLATAASYGPTGRSVELRDRSDLVVEIFENGYYLLTGRTAREDGWEARFLTYDDYVALAEERNDPQLKRARGWCCIRADTGLQLVMRGDLSQDEATAVTAHEAGHAFQRLLNPAQLKAPRDSLIGAMREAEAYTFEVAITRKIGEYAGVETARWPSGYDWSPYLNSWRRGLRESVDDLTQEHNRGQLIMWQAVLHDPELSHLRKEFRRDEFQRDARVSADSMMDMYYRFVRLTPSEIGPYIDSITTESISDDLNFIFGTVGRRIGFHDIEFPDLTLNVPTLVISP